MERIVNGTKIKFCLGDITDQQVAAVVNAANNSLLGGAGVDGAIHRVGGPAILAECKKVRARQGGCPTGEAVITTGGNLPAEYVIHTVGPIWQGGGEGEAGLLQDCYLNSLKLAVSKGISSIAFPAISTGAFGYPKKEAAEIALAAVREFLQSKAGEKIAEVRFVLYHQDDLNIYLRCWEEI
ncbi:MAG: O-acetyl-ADP-ribose deacetylase [Halanaerobium sp.]|nr:O-acetyl-ADP-ribose deacetylase [Halanaerobium sp.]